jgi:hypothetical protein
MVKLDRALIDRPVSPRGKENRGGNKVRAAEAVNSVDRQEILSDA